MNQVKTDDNSVTYHSEKYDEHYHSKSGAVEESFKKFAIPSKVEQKAKLGNLVILDICFGLGYNTAAAIDVALNSNSDCNIEIFALENDQDIIDEMDNVNPEIKNYDLLRQLAQGAINSNIKLNLLVGDARKTIKEIKAKVDVVFLDPFSPKKCPELWTEEFFKDINDVMKDDAILTTYSCARVVRNNLQSVGFRVYDGPIVGRRSPSTIAVKL